MEPVVPHRPALAAKPSHLNSGRPTPRLGLGADTVMEQSIPTGDLYDHHADAVQPIEVDHQQENERTEDEGILEVRRQ